MKPEAQRIAIARACGVELLTPGWVPTFNDPDNASCAPAAEPAELPDYLNDLNAMYEAEKTVLDTLPSHYTDWLWKVVFGGTPDYISNSELASFCHATAAQRAEAFLRTIGKWDDSK